MGEREEGREGQWERRREGERSNMYILVYIQYCIQYATYITLQWREMEGEAKESINKGTCTCTCIT